MYLNTRFLPSKNLRHCDTLTLCRAIAEDLPFFFGLIKWDHTEQISVTDKMPTYRQFSNKSIGMQEWKGFLFEQTVSGSKYRGRTLFYDFETNKDVDVKASLSHEPLTVGRSAVLLFQAKIFQSKQSSLKR